MLLRHPDQTISAPGAEAVEPPAYFAEAAYAAGVEAGSGVVKLEQAHRAVVGTFVGTVRGVRVRLRVLGETNDEAVRRLLVAIRRV